MNESETNVTNQTEKSFSYMAWHEHLKKAITSSWKIFFIFSLICFGVIWGLIEAANFFLPNMGLSNIFILYIGLFLSFIISFLRCIYSYYNIEFSFLKEESKRTHEIVRNKKQFWEYDLAYELLIHRISKIDQQLEDIANNRIHINIIKTLNHDRYMQWISTRPSNLLGMIKSASQLLILDLPNAIHNNNADEALYVQNLIRITNLVRDLYVHAYNFEIEGREIKIPEEFELLHEIQLGWITVIRKGFNQMLTLLQSVAKRSKNNLNPIEGTIVFGELPRIQEFYNEMDRLQSII